MPFAGASVQSFSPDILQAGAVKGLKVTSAKRAQRNGFHEMRRHKDARCVPFLEDCRALCFNLGTAFLLSRSFRPSTDSCVCTPYKSIHTHTPVIKCIVNTAHAPLNHDFRTELQLSTRHFWVQGSPPHPPPPPTHTHTNLAQM